MCVAPSRGILATDIGGAKFAFSGAFKNVLYNVRPDEKKEGAKTVCK